MTIALSDDQADWVAAQLDPQGLDRTDLSEPPIVEAPQPKCPKCAGKMRLIEKGRNGPWYGCSTWAQSGCKGSLTPEEAKHQLAGELK